MQAMDLSEISRARTLIDIDVANARILQLSIEIDKAAEQLRQLRSELGEPEASPPTMFESPTTPASAPHAVAATKLGAKFGLMRMRRRAAPVEMRWHVDEVGGVPPTRSKDGINVSVPLASYGTLTLSGWIVPLESQPPFTSASIVISGPSGQITRKIQTHIRDDVAVHFSDSNFASSGFRFDVPMSDLTKGTHAIELRGYSPSRGEVACRVGCVDLT